MRSWLCAGVILLAFLGVALAFRLLADRWPLGKRVGEGAAAAQAEGKRAALAERASAREALRENRLGAAFDYYRGVDRARWEAADSFTLALALLERDRMVLGWAALEAARRADPKHAPTLAALDAIQGKLTLAAGRQRMVLHDVAGRVELLFAVQGAEPLGVLVLGIASYADDASVEQELLDRLLLRDRAVLRAVSTGADALKLVARLLLEAGKASEARALLEPVVARPQPEPGSGATRSSSTFRAAIDAEAAWLLSRAALQLDLHETADAMLELAGGFGKSAPAASEPSPYAGSTRCRDCHHALYRQEQRASAHARTLWLGKGLAAVPLPARPVADAVIPRLTHSFARVTNDRIDLTSQADNRVVHAVIEYALGSGRHGITMVARDAEGIERELRVSYFHEGESWGQTKGIDSLTNRLDELIGLGLAPRTVRNCLHCHATWFRSVDLSTSGPRGPEARDHGIGCERCHGPGLHHVKAVETGFAELAIGLGANAPSSQRLHSCVECHAADGSVATTDPEFARAQGTTLLFSRCFTASKGQIDCTTCHNPHGVLDENITHYEAKCLGCHPGSISQRETSNGQSPRDAGRAARPLGRTCPVNPADACISCHMPKVEDRTRRSRFTDHHIRVHRTWPGALTEEAGE